MPIARLIFLKAYYQVQEFFQLVVMKGSMITRIVYDFRYVIFASPKLIYFSWEPPHLCFVKINFDDSKCDQGDFGGSGFVIKNATGIFIVAGG